MMKYTLNDTTSYVFYNGISELDIKELVSDIAKGMGYTIRAFDTQAIRMEINDDEELQQVAKQSYVPYPVQAGCPEEYKKSYCQLAEACIAPGYGIVPDEMVYAAVEKAMQRYVDKVIIPLNLKVCKAIVYAAQNGRIVNTREEARKKKEEWYNSDNEDGYDYVPRWVTDEEYDNAVAYIKAHEKKEHPKLISSETDKATASTNRYIDPDIGIISPAYAFVTRREMI